MKHIGLSLSIIFVSFLFSNCKHKDYNQKKDNQLIIFHAGSLSVPFKQMKDCFEKENPNVKILLESAGSIRCARKITDLKKDCNLMASADYTIIDEMLIPEYADWNIKFATNEMSIAYHKSSKYSQEISTQNCYDILLRDDVIFGRSNPDSDPCGYRAILTTQLAEIYYEKPNLTKKIIAKNQNYMRPKEVDLLALLETNTIDYIFLYRSVAQQHKLDFISLPDSINLNNPALEEFYKRAKVDITGKTPGSIITKAGQAMVYGITILKDSPNKELAIRFTDFILSEQGGTKIMEENGQASIIPTYSETYNLIPEKLKKYAKHRNN